MDVQFVFSFFLNAILLMEQKYEMCFVNTFEWIFFEFHAIRLQE